MSNFLSRLHTDLRTARISTRGATHRPEDVPIGTHKEYIRMPRIVLPVPQALDMRLDEALSKRASFVQTKSERPFTTSELGSLLGHALGKRGDITRKYPSGGAHYPIETYVLGTVVEGYAPGVFHYHPTAHALEHLWDLPATFKMSDVFLSRITPLSRTLLLFTGVWSRSAAKYGDWAYHLAMLEAGHMAQNILLTATALKAEARPAGGFNDDLVSELLDLDEREQPMYSILLAPETAVSDTGSVYE